MDSIQSTLDYEQYDEAVIRYSRNIQMGTAGLKAAMILRGVKPCELEMVLGISRSAWHRKMSEITEFTRREIVIISRYLKLDESEIMAIFFNDVVSFN